MIQQSFLNYLNYKSRVTALDNFLHKRRFLKLWKNLHSTYICMMQFFALFFCILFRRGILLSTEGYLEKLNPCEVGTKMCGYKLQVLHKTYSHTQTFWVNKVRSKFELRLGLLLPKYSNSREVVPKMYGSEF